MMKLDAKGQPVDVNPCAVSGCNGGTCPCGECHGLGYTYVADPSGEREEFMGVETPVMLERYCDCPKGRRMSEAGS